MCPDNVTFSIDLATSWMNSSVVVKTIPKNGPPILNYEILSRSLDGSSFYMWGGGTAFNGKLKDTPTHTLWKFTSDLKGGGIWSQEIVVDLNFPELPRTWGCLSAVGKGTVYYIGGEVTSYSDNLSKTLPQSIRNIYFQHVFGCMGQW